MEINSESLRVLTTECSPSRLLVTPPLPRFPTRLLGSKR